ncbi:hypothetical protein O6P43_021834 [Quillaja saponaria]|uniref:Uncharacterized protein n=1 Tax=Quillaja saponaria TaxID=32244 RepID=A0AAD7LBQ4_QUISA|nr:hypothetical protein O6P43_021834 [Quillaja saponaria]
MSSLGWDTHVVDADAELMTDHWGRMTSIISSRSDGSKGDSTHVESLDHDYGSFSVEGKGFDNSTEVVNIDHGYIAGTNCHRAFMRIQKSKSCGLWVEMKAMSDFPLVPKRHRRSVTGGGRFSVSEIQSETFSYGPCTIDQGHLIVEKARGKNGSIKMLRVTHKYYNTERDGPLIICHRIGKNQTYNTVLLQSLFSSEYWNC